jgi:hypothetical protein
VVQPGPAGRIGALAERGGAGKPQPDYFAANADALCLRSVSLGFEAEVNGDRNVRGNGLAVPRCWFVPVLLQGFHRGFAQ